MSGIGNRNAQHRSQVAPPTVGINRSLFNRSFAIKDTFDFDYLTPIFVDEILPGDEAHVTLNTFARLSTQLKPIMDNMYIDYFFFFVPSRLVFDNWEKFNGAQDNPGDSTDYILPQLTFPAGGPEVGTIYDKYGLPTDVAGSWTIKNSLPFRCYPLIWNEWFRDQNMQNSIVIDKGAGPDVPADFTLLKRNKRHDYFTSALPWPQKGAAVELPLGTTAPIHGINQDTQIFTTTNASLTSIRFNTASGTNVLSPTDNLGGNSPIRFSTNPAQVGLVADLSSATAATINQLREAFAMQSLFELDARGGTRYVEILLSHFKVQSPDFRLQRPEYLGGGTDRINSHPVPQTSQSETGAPQANLAAFGTASSQGRIGFSKSFVEHGYVIGLACARADLTYQQGVDRMFNRSTRYEFYWPELASLGEQALLRKEIYCVGGTPATSDDVVFGYQERFAEYRSKKSEIHGEFRSTYATSLDYWHLAEEFGSAPGLNSAFIQQNTPIERAVAVSSAPDILFDGFFTYNHIRPIPVYAVPAKLGRM